MDDDLERVLLSRSEVLALAVISAYREPGESPDIAALRERLEDVPHTVFLIESVAGAVRIGLQATDDRHDAASFVVSNLVWQYLLIRQEELDRG